MDILNVDLTTLIKPQVTEDTYGILLFLGKYPL